MRHRRTKRGTLWWTLAASALVHGVVAGPIRRELEAFLSASAPGVRPPVRVVELSPEQWSNNAKAAPGSAAERARSAGAAPASAAPSASASPSPSPSPSPTPEPEDLSGQIVDVAKTADDSFDPSARFLSRQNTKVEKETAARIQDVDRRLTRVTPKLEREGSALETVGKTLPTPEVTVKGDGRASDRAKSEKSESLVLKVPEILRQEGLDLDLPRVSGPGVTPRKARESLRGKGDELDLRLGKSAPDAADDEGGRAGAKDGNGDRPIPALSALMPTIGTLDRISGSPREAHLDGVEEGDATFLNAKEFKYATFFLRVRDAVADQWEGAMTREYHRRDPTGQIYGTRDRSTLVAVVLRPGGELAEVKVESTSGVDFLDDVAIDAFRKAQPFPNPPAGIVDADGFIRIQFMLTVVGESPSPFRFRALPPP